MTWRGLTHLACLFAFCLALAMPAWAGNAPALPAPRPNLKTRPVKGALATKKHKTKKKTSKSVAQKRKAGKKIVHKRRSGNGELTQNSLARASEIKTKKHPAKRGKLVKRRPLQRTIVRTIVHRQVATPRTPAMIIPAAPPEAPKPYASSPASPSHPASQYVPFHPKAAPSGDRGTKLDMTKNYSH